jgi:hypothetical protein
MNIATEPVLLYVLWHRLKRGEKWRKVAQCSTRAEVVNLIRSSGEWWLAEVRTADLANSLLADVDQPDAPAPAA